MSAILSRTRQLGKESVPNGSEISSFEVLKTSKPRKCVM